MEYEEKHVECIDKELVPLLKSCKTSDEILSIKRELSHLIDNSAPIEFGLVDVYFNIYMCPLLEYEENGRKYFPHY